ncbi:MAG TPA: hypothetical protein VGS10_02275 [Terracidiphilus sp.]|nr:hypothetical protein [Terracidiphilus sp.]
MVEKVEKRRADKVARFVELLRDPELATYVSLLRNGSPEHAPGLAAFDSPTAFKRGNGIREVIVTLNLPDKFTSEDVLAQLEQRSFPFSSKDHKGAVRDALFKLARGEKSPFRIVTKGAGGKPNIYGRRAL